MRIKAFAHIGDPAPLVKEAAVVIIEDGGGTPLAVASEYGGGYFICHCNDPEFNQALRVLGINRLVIAEPLEKKLKSPQELPLLCGS